MIGVSATQGRAGACGVGLRPAVVSCQTFGMAGASDGYGARIRSIIGEYLGASTAEKAVRLAAATWVHREPDALRVEDLPAMRRGLEPMLCVFLGAEVTKAVLGRIDQEVRP